jgi:succinate-semialdehyde dehydrogenase/glutarate-semialdehyde dehydrogenase
MVIDGRPTDGGRELRTNHSPATGEPVGSVVLGGAQDVDAAVRAARAAAGTLGRLGPFERAALCERVADAIERRQAELGELLALEHGKPLADAVGEIAGSVGTLHDVAEQIRWARGEIVPARDESKRVFVSRRPHGVLAAITPWNFPVGVPVHYYLAPGLAAGNAIVWIPAPSTSAIASRLTEVMLEADLPAGTINVVTGEGPVVGQAAASHRGVDVVGFTGSTQVGERVSLACAGKPSLIELGGNGPAIVLRDADLELAAREIAAGSFSNAGQICTSTGRVLAHASIAGELAERVSAHARELTVGLPLDPRSTMGCVHHEGLADQIVAQLEDAAAAGAAVVCGGGRLDGFPTRNFIAPTVVDLVPADAPLHVDETFGPVTPIVRFADERDLAALVDATPFGLFAAVFSADVPAAMRLAETLPAGTVNVNSSTSWWEAHLPAGGASGRASGVGRAGGAWSIAELSQVHTITVALPEREGPLA